MPFRSQKLRYSFADPRGLSNHNRHGAQNAYDAPSKSTLENEFGTKNEDECMIKILEQGTLQETEVRAPILPPEKSHANEIPA